MVYYMVWDGMVYYIPMSRRGIEETAAAACALLLWHARRMAVSGCMYHHVARMRT